MKNNNNNNLYLPPVIRIADFVPVAMLCQSFTESEQITSMDVDEEDGGSLFE